MQALPELILRDTQTAVIRLTQFAPVKGLPGNHFRIEVKKKKTEKKE